MLRPSRLAVIVAVAAVTVAWVSQASAGGRHGYSGWRGGYYGYGSSYRANSYANPYLNPYSYESQALPYWLKPGYQAASDNYEYSAPARRADRFGAIAYSRSTGALGYSYGHGSRNDAEQDALSRCDASDRKVVGWMRNAYGALAVGDDPEAYGWAWGVTRNAAEQAALAACRKQTTNCTIKQWVFSGN